MLPRRSARNSAEGLATCARPWSVISNTPISSVAPKRFFTARRMRNWWPRSPSKYSTASTMCSSTRGPAMAPSLVTWPTSTSAKPADLARRISSNAAARTWATVPGALSMVSSHIVWIESITTSAASGARSRAAVISRRLIAAASSSGASATARRRARRRTWSTDSSPETYSTRRPARASAAAACSNSVDLPMPGSPPTSTADPATRPPPSTRSSSSIPVPARGGGAASPTRPTKAIAVPAATLATPTLPTPVRAGPA